MRTILYTLTYLCSLSLGGESSSEKNAVWIPEKPVHIKWTSGGKSNILEDHSVQLTRSVGWQECTLYFQFSEPTTIEKMQLEWMPLQDPKAYSEKELILFDVKPHLKHHSGDFTQLEFKNCTFLGNPDDSTIANCIDFLTDTGWKIPAFEEQQLPHVLVMQLSKPVTISSHQEFGITMDLSASTKKTSQTRFRVSFNDH